MKTKQTKIIKTTFQKMSDIVTPTMGAKGRLAVLQDEFSRPFLTDDGVTVAKECMNFEDAFEKMIAMSIIEAANNTENPTAGKATMNESTKKSRPMMLTTDERSEVTMKVSNRAGIYLISRCSVSAYS